MSESVNLGQCELLQQLKQRLKKTKSETPVQISPRLLEVNIMTGIAEKVEPSVAVITKTDSKLKKVFEIFFKHPEEIVISSHYIR